MNFEAHKSGVNKNCTVDILMYNLRALNLVFFAQYDRKFFQFMYLLNED